MASLLDDGANPDVTGSDGRTPLFWVCKEMPEDTEIDWCAGITQMEPQMLAGLLARMRVDRKKGGAVRL